MKVINVDILIIIEHKVRELESACLLKYELEKKGYTVCIDSVYPNKEELPLKYKADIIFLPWAYDNHTMEYIKCFLKNSPNAKLINFHHEQYSGQDDKNICLPSGEARDLYHISWGEKFTNSLIKCGCDAEKIFTTGNIKLDFYKSKLKNMFYSKNELSKIYNIPTNKKWALFIANGYHLMPEWKIDSIAISDNEIYEKKDAAIANRLSFLEYADNYLSEKKDIIFIYRPHPVYADTDKKNKDIMKLCKKYPKNFYIISDLAIGNWLTNCNICLSFHSTSAVECCISKIPYCLFRTTPLRKDLDYPFFEDYKYIIKNYSDFKKILNTNDYNNDILKTALTGYYLIEDEFTFKQIIKFVEKCDNVQIRKYTYKMWMKNYFRYIIKKAIIILSKINLFNKIFNKITDNRIKRIIDNNSADSFTNEEIAIIINKINNSLKKRSTDK